MNHRFQSAFVQLLLATTGCLSLSACQTVAVSPAWNIPPDVSVQTVNNYPLAFTARGTGPTVVFVHGVLTDYRYWQRPLETWVADFKVLAVSMRHFFPEKWDGKGSNFTIRLSGAPTTGTIAVGMIGFLGQVSLPLPCPHWFRPLCNRQGQPGSGQHRCRVHPHLLVRRRFPAPALGFRLLRNVFWQPPLGIVRTRSRALGRFP